MQLQTPDKLPPLPRHSYLSVISKTWRCSIPNKSAVRPNYCRYTPQCSCAETVSHVQDMPDDFTCEVVARWHLFPTPGWSENTLFFTCVYFVKLGVWCNVFPGLIQTVSVHAGTVAAPVWPSVCLHQCDGSRATSVQHSGDVHPLHSPKTHSMMYLTHSGWLELRIKDIL